MKLDIKDRKKNPLMKREEVMVSIDHAGSPTPNRKQVMEEAAKALKTKAENLIVTKISTPAGSTRSEVKIFSYSKKEDIPEWKVKKFNERMAKIKPEKPAEPAPAAPAGEAAPGPPGEDPKTDNQVTDSPEGKPEEAPGEQPAEEAPKEEPPKEEPAKEEAKPDPEEKPSEEKPAGEKKKEDGS